jgi:hypothetical protein
MTAHPIGHDVKLVVLQDRKAVFVVIPLESYVSESGRDRAHFPSKNSLAHHGFMSDPACQGLLAFRAASGRAREWPSAGAPWGPA